MKIFFILLLSSLIGYITNYIAIKMVFKPHKPIFIFGKRLPLTPGLIPKEKARISQNVGEAVAKLITPEQLKKRLITDEVLLIVKMSINQVFDRHRLAKYTPEPVRIWVFFKLMETILMNFNELVTQVDIARSVSESMNKFSNSDLEKMVVSVVHKELRAITWFGALLGLIIGIIQIAIIRL